jgi:tetratricopeptide (TPR) repeat protein
VLVGDYARIHTMCHGLIKFLDFTGRWDDLLWFSTKAEARVLAADDRDNAGWYAYWAGRVYAGRTHPAEVLACAARAAEHLQDSTPRDKAFAITLRGLGHKLNKDYPAAIAAYREVVEIYRSISPESDDIAFELNGLAGAEHANKDYPAAERDYREALRVAKVIKNDEHVATLTGNLAELALDREQWADAESLAREALQLAEKVGRQEVIANCCHFLAKALLKQKLALSDSEGSNLEEALSMSRRAVEIYTRLRQQNNLLEAQKTLAEIEKARSASE